MPYITVGQENSAPIELYYEDQGSGQPVLLIHGWPLNGASWEKQTMALLNAGYRVITYDRRGFGQSSKPSIGYEYETFTDDLNEIITQLKLRNVILAGFSMGTGEVAHYLGKYGSDNISKAIFIAVVPPFLLKTPEHSQGIDRHVFSDIQNSLLKDRPAFLWQFLQNFYNFDVFQNKRISDQALQASWNVSLKASALAIFKSVESWMTDFRKDLPFIDVPTLIIHGNADRILPVEVSGRALAQALRDAHYVELDGGPHGLLLTHAEEVIQEILSFLGSAPHLQQRMDELESRYLL